MGVRSTVSEAKATCLGFIRTFWNANLPSPQGDSCRLSHSELSFLCARRTPGSAEPAIEVVAPSAEWKLGPLGQK